VILPQATSCYDNSVEQNPPRYRIEAVDRALVLIRLLNERRSVSVSEVADALDVAPSSAHRLLATLCHRGFAVQDQQRRYHPGPELSATGPPAPPLPHLRRVLRPFLQDLFERTGETVHLVVPAGPDVRFVDGIEGDQPLRVGLRTGTRMPAYCISGGKAMLADLDWSEVEALHPHGLAPWPFAKLRDLPSLRRQLARVRRQGYGVNTQESEAGLIAFGVSVRSRAGRPMAALTVAIPTARFDRRHEPGLAARLMEARGAAEPAVAALQ
jgi:IclR family transcriptional regulator, acetate operon repressor